MLRFARNDENSRIPKSNSRIPKTLNSKIYAKITKKSKGNKMRYGEEIINNFDVKKDLELWENTC
ncbi:MAG: hypothetical protein SO045_05405, partial [Campylobacter sp.]|nr:hypothetical protein [Campylobacter sp.]